jgi:hypothetical protein
MSPQILTRLLEAALAAYVVLMLTVLFMTVPAGAHEWYPYECCSDHDCGPIALEQEPVEEHGGFRLLDGRFMPYREIKNSPDNQWHLCESKWQPEPKDRKILCLYAPIGGV